MVVGDSNGHVGLGVKCAKEVATAIRGAIILAKTSVVPVRRGYWGNKIGKPHTVPTKSTGKCGSVTVSGCWQLIALHRCCSGRHHGTANLSMLGDGMSPCNDPGHACTFCRTAASSTVHRFLMLTTSTICMQVRLIPAPRGAGIVAARVPKKVLQMAGIDDCYTASRGSTKTLGNFVKVGFYQVSEVRSRIVLGSVSRGSTKTLSNFVKVGFYQVSGVYISVTAVILIGNISRGATKTLGDLVL